MRKDSHKQWTKIKRETKNQTFLVTNKLECHLKIKMMATNYNWKRFFFLHCIAGILFVLIIISNQNEILPQVYSVTTSDPNISSNPNSASVAGVIIITKNDKRDLIFKPQTLTMEPGEEVFIGNHDTSPQSITNVLSANDPLSAKLFNTGS